MQQIKEPSTFDGFLMSMTRFFRFLPLLVLSLSFSGLLGQKLGVFNEKGNKIYTVKSGRNIDFRVDYDKLYAGNQDSILEVRIYGLVDSIQGEKLFLSENIVVLYYTRSNFIEVEKEYEYTDLDLHLDDVKSLSFSSTGASIGNALFTVGLATIIASPILGLTPSGFSTERFAQAAAIGIGTALLGGGLKWAFGQKPVKFKEFEGPDYYKKYQSGRLSVIPE